MKEIGRRDFIVLLTKLGFLSPVTTLCISDYTKADLVKKPQVDLPFINQKVKDEIFYLSVALKIETHSKRYPDIKFSQDSLSEINSLIYSRADISKLIEGMRCYSLQDIGDEDLKDRIEALGIAEKKLSELQNALDRADWNLALAILGVVLAALAVAFAFKFIVVGAGTALLASTLLGTGSIIVQGISYPGSGGLFATRLIFVFTLKRGALIALTARSISSVQSLGAVGFLISIYNLARRNLSKRELEAQLEIHREEINKLARGIKEKYKALTENKNGEHDAFKKEIKSVVDKTADDYEILLNASDKKSTCKIGLSESYPSEERPIEERFSSFEVDRRWSIFPARHIDLGRGFLDLSSKKDITAKSEYLDLNKRELFFEFDLELSPNVNRTLIYNKVLSILLQTSFNENEKQIDIVVEQERHLDSGDRLYAREKFKLISGANEPARVALAIGIKKAGNHIHLTIYRNCSAIGLYMRKIYQVGEFGLLKLFGSEVQYDSSKFYVHSLTIAKYDPTQNDDLLIKGKPAQPSDLNVNLT